MPCAAEVAVQLTGRFGQYVGWRCADEASQIAVATALQAAAHNDAHARRIVDAWCRSAHDAPLESDIWALAESVPHQDDGDVRPDHRCECGGSGFRQIWVLVDYAYDAKVGRLGGRKSTRITQAEYEDLRGRVDGVVQNVYVGVEACLCGYGQRLQEARRVRAAMDSDEAATASGGARRRR